MPSGCLDRLTTLAVATERCPPNKLRHVRRHLSKCSRCQAQVVRAAQGRLGDTLEDEPRRPRAWLWAVPVAVSVAAWGFAWPHGKPPVVPPTSKPPPVFVATPPVLEATLPVLEATLPALEVTPPVLEATSPTEVTAPTEDTAPIQVPAAAALPAADTRDPCHDAVPVRLERPAPHRRVAGVSRDRPAPAAEPPVVAEVNPTESVLVDGRRVRVTLE